MTEAHALARSGVISWDGSAPPSGARVRVNGPARSFLAPPVGAVQFVACAIGKISVWEAMRSIWPFYGAGLVVLGLVTYIPALSLWLPSVFR